MRNLVLILMVIIAASCGEQPKDVVNQKTPVSDSNSIVTSTPDQVVKEEKLFSLNDLLINKKWSSVYLINKGDTIKSDKPFFIQFDTINNSFSVGNESGKENKWEIQDSMLTLNSGGVIYGKYKILELNDSTLRTADSVIVGDQHLFKAVN